MAQKWIKTTALILAGIGSLNWGLLALFGFNLVTWIAALPVLSSIAILSNIVYGAVAISGGYVLYEALVK